MAFADPQSVTISAVAKSLAEFDRSSQFAQYKHLTEDLMLETRKDWKPNSFRTQARLIRRAMDIDAFNTSLNRRYEYDAYLVLRGPTMGVSVGDMLAHAQAMVAWCDTTNLTKLLGGQV